MQKPKIIVIVGPTASGKTSLSIQLAQKFNGEVISADSRQVYRGLDIGTGKVTREEMQDIPHYLLDVTDPQVTYTVADFVRDGRDAITTIVSHKKTPIVVGGTFFYTDALLGKISAPEVPPNDILRAELEGMSNEALMASIQEKDPVRAASIDPHNRRRLIRAREIIDAVGIVPQTENQEIYDVLTLGISISREDLKNNIHARLIKRIDEGMIKEVQNLLKNNISYERMYELGIEYKYITLYLEEKIIKEEMLAQIETKSLQYAKRQMTWLKRNTDIVWIKPPDTETIEELVANFLK